MSEDKEMAKKISNKVNKDSNSYVWHIYQNTLIVGLIGSVVLYFLMGAYLVFGIWTVINTSIINKSNTSIIWSDLLVLVIFIGIGIILLMVAIIFYSKFNDMRKSMKKELIQKDNTISQLIVGDYSHLESLKSKYPDHYDCLIRWSKIFGAFLILILPLSMMCDFTFLAPPDMIDLYWGLGVVPIYYLGIYWGWWKEIHIFLYNKKKEVAKELEERTLTKLEE